MSKNKQSAGILLYRKGTKDIEVLLGHPGGPFLAKKDKGVWSIPKGEFDDELAIDAAKREYQEELGSKPPEGELLDLGTVKMKSGKVIYAWAVEGDFNVATVKSNTFSMQWPSRSGNEQEFPEIDRASWFSLAIAKEKLVAAQAEFIDRLADILGVSADAAVDGSAAEAESPQISLF